MICILVLSGCASVPMASLDQDSRAKEFSPPPNKSSIYIYRHENFGAAIPMTVSVNGRALGQSGAQTYFYLNVNPGKFTIESHAENISNLPLVTEAGKNYFVWQEIKMGMWMARSLLQQTDEAAGRAGVLASKLIATAVSGNDLNPLDAPKSISADSSSLGSNSVTQKLRDLQILRKEGVITEEEFDKKKQQLLQKL